MTDFANPKYIGATVTDHRFGVGKITGVSTDHVICVHVTFQNGDAACYTNDGRNHPSQYPILLWGEHEPLDQGEPQTKPKEKGLNPLKFNGNPVWAYVSNREDGLKHKKKAKVVATLKGGRYIAIRYGETNIACYGTELWKYAWDIEK